jgi:hypothetical protein
MDAEVAVGLSAARTDARGFYRVDVGFAGTVCAITREKLSSIRRVCAEPSPTGTTRIDLHVDNRPGEEY